VAGKCRVQNKDNLPTRIGEHWKILEKYSYKNSKKQMLMAARQKRLVADTAKLASLAADLKTQVDHSSTTTLPADLIKKANDIEKLAHDVKQRLKG